ncbi:Alpha/Beta hydrolase protein [Cristinia sonorae]|uniref:Alpha/Beta hydrolase protein n=1 Tax=Cristinia sonorae TaxID=1940300 RepID=A0A8K0XTR8_9AGAR|nr:Alpha/Beta hydrolase protein [Cristinia sonorae]
MDATTPPRSYKRTSTVVQSADGTPIYADSVGDASKPSIIFVHGFGLSGIAFDGIFEEGSEGRNQWEDDVYLVRYDLRGHGRSGKPEDAASWDSKRLAEDFDAVVKAFGLARPFLATWSLGGLTVTDVLAHFPPRYLSGVILLAGYPSAGGVLKIATPSALALIPPLLDPTNTIATAQSFIASFTAPESPQLSYTMQQAMLANIVTQPKGCTVHILTRTQDEAGFWAAGKEGLPMLVITGTVDPLVDQEGTRKFFEGTEDKQWKDIQFVSLEGVGHMPFWERPAKVRDTMLGFVARYRTVQ